MKAFTVANYWQLPSPIQQEIKAAYPITPLYTWRVRGQLNIQTYTTGYGFPVDQDVEAVNATEAADKVARNHAVWYKNVKEVKWLNDDGPIVNQIITPAA